MTNEWIALLWLLLPLAALSGWWAAWRSMKAAASEGQKRIHPEYFKGLNFVLNEQPDKAIEVFIRMLEVDSETVETHLALGNLFRRRGEVDRAIRIHQNLIARPTLDRQQRTHALLELGQDYMRAGLLDRAETLFQELIDMNEHVEPALRYLIDIYQQEKDWDRAIPATQKLAAVTGKSRNAVIAHYYCELAEQARQHDDLERTRQLLKEALASDRACVRASLLLADMDMKIGDYGAAMYSLKKVRYQDPDYLSEALRPLLECYDKLGQTRDAVAYLTELLCEHKSITLMLAMAELLRREQGDHEAAA